MRSAPPYLLALPLVLASSGLGACRGTIEAGQQKPPATTMTTTMTRPAGADAADAVAQPAPPEPPGRSPSDGGSGPDGPRAADASREGAVAMPPAADASGRLTGASLVFDTSVLHRIDIRVESQHLVQLDMDLNNRVPCTVTYDGTTITAAGIRKKGGPGSLRPLAEKPAFSIKFNQFVKGQKLAGLSKLLLNNAAQDESFLSEHLAYEIVRRAGGAAPLTAHGVVVLNGRPLGLYVVREAFNGDFIARTFGPANQGGNFYEGGEFVRDPESPELKDEREEMRSRADLRELSALIRNTPDPQWVGAVGAKLDLQSFMVGWAVEALVDHWDGYFFGPHNHYLYHHPGTDRVVLLVAGMDDIFSRIRDPRDSTRVLLADKLLRFPDTRERFRNLLVQIVGGFDLPGMLARIDQTVRTVHSQTPTDPATRADVARFDSRLPEVRSDMAAIRAWPVPVF